MSRIGRDTVDVAVAFEVAMKRRRSVQDVKAINNTVPGSDLGLETSADVASSAGTLPDSDLGLETTADVASSAGTLPESYSNLNEVFRPRLRLGIRVKSVLRPFARVLFRMARPVARPVAFRFRRYLLDGFRHELAQQESAAGGLRSQLADLRAEQESAAGGLRSQLADLRAEQESAAGGLRSQLADLRAEQESAAGGLRSQLADLLPRLEQIEQYSGIAIRRVNSAAGGLTSQLADLLPRLEQINEYSGIAARRVAVSSGAGDVIVRTLVGYVLCSATDYALVTTLIEAGELEPGTRILIERILRPGNTFVDVGANIGLHTLAAARAMKGTGRIVAFEPFGPTKRRLDTTLWLNGFSSITQVYQAAVSNRTGSDKLFLGRTSGHHSLTPVELPEGQAEETVAVQLVTLDGTIGEGESVDLIKVDAEGAELDILQGATSIVKNNSAIALIVEFGPSHLKRTGNTVTGWISKFTELGLSYLAINPDTGLLEAMPMEALEATASINLLFARPESPVWLELAPNK